MGSISVRGAVIIAGILWVVAPAWAQSSAPAAPGTQGFNVVLVLGDLHDGASSDNIPAAARAALGDLKDFLPYRSYRVLDTAWILGSTTQLFRAKSRLRGADDQTYEVSLTSSPTGPPAPPSLQMKFVMQDRTSDSFGTSDAAHKEAQMKAELVQSQAARAALEKSAQSIEPNETAEDRRQRQRAIRAQISDLTKIIDATQIGLESSTVGQMLIDTSFSMRIGETVVVGTSRVRGDKALIALLTAVRK
jgi:hypothetical protein